LVGIFQDTPKKDSTLPDSTGKRGPMATRGLGAPEWGEGAQPLGEKTFSFCCARFFLLFRWTVRKAEKHRSMHPTQAPSLWILLSIFPLML